VIIRRLRPEDAPAVQALEEAGMQHPWTAGQVAGELESAAGLGFGAEDRGQLRAFAFFRCYPPECELLRIVVHPDARRQGLAERLLSLALTECAALGALVCFLEVRASNGAALALYERQGFRIDGRRRRYYDSPEEDALLLHKHVSNTGENNDKSA